MCDMCDESYEGAIHVLFNCLRARNVWHDSHLLSKVNSTLQNNNILAEIIFALLQNMSQVQVEQFAIVVWSL